MVSCLKLAAGGNQRTRSGSSMVRIQLRCELEERRRRRDAPARLRPIGRALEVLRHRLVGSRVGKRQVP